VQRLPALDATRLGWVDPLGDPAASTGRHGEETVPDLRDLRLYVLRTKAAIFGAAAPDWRAISVSVGGGRPDPTGPVVRTRPSMSRRTAGSTTSAEHRCTPGRLAALQCRRTGPAGQENTIDLDATYPEASVGSWSC
jgi:hypothetical protein